MKGNRVMTPRGMGTLTGREDNIGVWIRVEVLLDTDKSLEWFFKHQTIKYVVENT